MVKGVVTCIEADQAPPYRNLPKPPSLTHPSPCCTTLPIPRQPEVPTARVCFYNS
ncbi:hypothetical protein M422DRAFT_26818 [Sphaerobolus stellatus SS14]|nr:hypothetical protein M422DRAFT_26818 [Sphaerobolus stellatus SS14]